MDGDNEDDGADSESLNIFTREMVNSPNNTIIPALSAIPSLSPLTPPAPRLQPAPTPTLRRSVPRGPPMGLAAARPSHSVPSISPATATPPYRPASLHPDFSATPFARTINRSPPRGVPASRVAPPPRATPSPRSAQPPRGVSPSPRPGAPVRRPSELSAHALNMLILNFKKFVQPQVHERLTRTYNKQRLSNSTAAERRAMVAEIIRLVGNTVYTRALTYSKKSSKEMSKMMMATVKKLATPEQSKFISDHVRKYIAAGNTAPEDVLQCILKIMNRLDPQLMKRCTRSARQATASSSSRSRPVAPPSNASRPVAAPPNRNRPVATPAPPRPMAPGPNNHIHSNLPAAATLPISAVVPAKRGRPPSKKGTGKKRGPYKKRKKAEDGSAIPVSSKKSKQGKSPGKKNLKPGEKSAKKGKITEQERQLKRQKRQQKKLEEERKKAEKARMKEARKEAKAQEARLKQQKKKLVAQRARDAKIKKRQLQVQDAKTKKAKEKERKDAERRAKELKARPRMFSLGRKQPKLDTEAMTVFESLFVMPCIKQTRVNQQFGLPQRPDDIFGNAMVMNVMDHAVANYNVANKSAIKLADDPQSASLMVQLMISSLEGLLGDVVAKTCALSQHRAKGQEKRRNWVYADSIHPRLEEQARTAALQASLSTAHEKLALLKEAQDEKAAGVFKKMSAIENDHERARQKLKRELLRKERESAGYVAELVKKEKEGALETFKNETARAQELWKERTVSDPTEEKNQIGTEDLLTYFQNGNGPSKALWSLF